MGLRHGAWQIDLPSSMTQLGKQQTDLQLSFDRQDEVFGDRAATQSAYLKHIQQAMESYEGQADVRIAACILEPVLQVTTLLLKDVHVTWVHFTQSLCQIAHVNAAVLSVKWR